MRAGIKKCGVTVIKICSPVYPDFNEVEKYLSKSFEVGHISNFGPAYLELVEKLKEYLELPEDRDIVLTSSGHTALMTAYFILDTNTCVLPSYTFPSTFQAAEIQGIFCEIADVDLKTGCLDLSQLDRFNYCDTVIVTTALSNIPNLKKIEKLVSASGKKLIIDGAPSFGTSSVCNYGDVFCFSFHATKTFPIGEGGALVCYKDDVEKAKAFINFGLDKNKNPSTYGINAKLSDYSCAIGLSIFEKIAWITSRRLQNAAIYKKRLRDLCLDSWIENTVYQTFPIFAEPARAEKIRSVLDNNNVQYLQYYQPFSNLSNAKSLYESNICLPVHQDLTLEQVNYICDLVLSV